MLTVSAGFRVSRIHHCYNFGSPRYGRAPDCYPVIWWRGRVIEPPASSWTRRIRFVNTAD